MNSAIVFTTGADNRQLSIGLNEAGQMAARKMVQIARRIATQSAAAGVAIGTAIVSGVRLAVGKMGQAIGSVKMQFDLAGQLNDLQAQTGIAVRDLFLLRQAFQENSLGADQVGGAVNRMQRQIALAARGNKAAVGTFNALGLNWAALKKLAPYEQFRKVAEAIAAMPDPAERAMAAKKMFGGAGGSMQALFANIGSVGDIGKTLGPQATALNNSAARMDEAGDKLDRFRTQFEGFYLGIATSVTDLLASTIASLEGIDFLAKGEAVGAAIVSFVAGTSTAWRWIQNAMDILQGGFAIALSVCAIVVDVLWQGIRRANDLFDNGFYGVLAIAQNLIATLIEGLVAIPLDLQTGLEFAFQSALEFFGNGFWDLIANVSAGLQFGLHSAIEGVVSALPGALKDLLGIADVAPKGFKQFQDESKQSVADNKSGFKAQSYQEIRARNFNGSPMLQAGMKLVQGFRDGAAQNQAKSQKAFAAGVGPKADLFNIRDILGVAADHFGAVDARNAEKPAASTAQFGPSMKEMGAGGKWDRFRNFSTWRPPMIQGSGGIQGAVGGLSNNGGASGGAYGYVRRGDAARRRQEKEAETDAAKKEKAKEKTKTAEGTNERLDGVNSKLELLLEEFQ